MVTTCSFALLLALMPSGEGRAMPALDLAKELSARTGVEHRIANRLKDWPLFVRVTGDDDERLRALVAASLRAQWVKEGERWILQPHSGFQPGDGSKAFLAGWQEAVKESPAFGRLPVEAMYRMRVGDQVLYSSEGEPDSLAAKRFDDGRPFRVLVRRLLGTVFEAGSNQMAVPMSNPDVIKGLGDSVRATIEVPKELLPQPRMGGSSIVFRPSGPIDGWSNMRQLEPLMKLVASKVSVDMVVALPDALSTIGFHLAPSVSVGKLVNDLGQYVEWEMESGALVGKMAAFDFGEPTQADRQKVDALLKENHAAFDTPILARYASGQPPLANLSMNSLLPLFLSGKPMDPSLHWPYDLYLYQVLSATDWQAIRSGKATLATLSPAVQRAVGNLLRKSRAAFSPTAIASPMIVAAQPPGNVPVTLEEEEAQAVFFRYGDRSPELMDELNLAAHRIWKDFDDQRASYLVATQRRLNLSIGGVVVPFLKLQIPPTSRYVRYAELPSDLQGRIEKNMQRLRDSRAGESGISPPPPALPEGGEE